MDIGSLLTNININYMPFIWDFYYLFLDYLFFICFQHETYWISITRLLRNTDFIEYLDNKCLFVTIYST